MKYTKVGDHTANGLELFCDDGNTRTASPKMLPRALVPRPGDFWVVQSNGFEYVAPQEIFGKTYQMLPSGSHTQTAAGGAPHAAA